MNIQTSRYKSVKIKYLSPTTTKGARLKCAAHIASATYDYHACDGKPEIALERFLAEKCPHWNNQGEQWVIGRTDNNSCASRNRQKSIGVSQHDHI